MFKVTPILDVLLLLSCFWLVACSESKPEGETQSVPEAATLFTLLDPITCGINFENRLTEGPNTNILVYEYFYNGGGVAAGDLNGDGLADLYFTANMSANRLYLNQGNLHFRDVTRAAGANLNGPWNTGVTMADVNADGRLDIYLCRSGALPPAKRANVLLINQGNDEAGVPQFKNEATAYGLASTAFSNQMYFFDYDRDGDLDGLLLNHNPVAMPVLNATKTKELLKVPDPERGLQLYRNDNGKFKEVTRTAGISNSALSYGLGVAISDLDGDGDADFYVSNDYEVPDYLYYNNGDGTFTDGLGDAIGHTSHFSMGSDAADVNNDGLIDIFTLDMLPEDHRRRQLLMPDDNRSKLDLNIASGFHYQTMRNMLHLNRGNGTYAEVGQLAGVARTDWSWSALLADYDNDGWQDLHITNGYLKDFTNQDFTSYMKDWVNDRKSFKREDLRELLRKLEASDVNNYAYQNRGDGTFADATQTWGIERPSNSNGATYADLDNDGDLDLVVNNLDKQAFVYRNDATGNHWLKVKLEGGKSNLAGIGARAELTIDGETMTRELYPGRGYLSSVEPVLHFGLGARTRVQRLLISWADGAVQTLENLDANQALTLRRSDASSSAKMAVSSGSSGEGSLFKEVAPPVPFTDKLSDKRDFDNEPLLPRQYSYTGNIFRPHVDERTGEVIRMEATRHVKSPLVFDVDGQRSYIMGNEYLRNKYPFVGQIQGKIGGGSGPNGNAIKMEELPESLRKAGKITAMKAKDIDGDGKPEVILTGEWMPILIYSTEDGKLVDHPSSKSFRTQPRLKPGNYRSAQTPTPEIGPTPTGWWNTLHVTDLNGDGQPDIIAGNEGINNTFQATPETPLELRAADLDGNGTIDPILSYYAADGKRYPDATRDELLRQLTALRKRYPDYKSYADKTLDQVFPSWPEGTLYLTAERLETMLYLSQPDGNYQSAPLPPEVQYAPVHTITELDYNDDGNPDLLLCGNESLAKQRWGKSDANSGVLLRGDGKGGFTYIPQSESGFKLTGDVRSVVQIDDLLLFGVRGERVRAYRRSSFGGPVQ